MYDESAVEETSSFFFKPNKPNSDLDRDLNLLFVDSNARSKKEGDFVFRVCSY